MSTNEINEIEINPNISTFTILRQEIKRDKVALISLCFLILTSTLIVVTSFILNQAEVMTIRPLYLNLPPSSEHWLGTYIGGQDVFGMLIIGARNSLAIAALVTIISGVFGVGVGLISGYFGGNVDNIFMRIVDFTSILPMLMIVITFVSIFPNYTVFQFSLIMSAFLWQGIARMVRARAIAEKELEYIQASKTLGTTHLKTMLKELLPNISSVIIVTMTLNMAANVGLETALTFLGFGFPHHTPSLGTLVAAARNPQVLEMRWWIWVPASILILTLMLSVNSVGRALNRSTDAKQRRA